jgi:hypothetical protein
MTMLDYVISEVRLILEEAQQKLSKELAAPIEQIYQDIEKLNIFISKEIAIVENNNRLDGTAKRIAKREVIERAERKLEVRKAKRNYPALIKELEKKLKDTSAKQDDSILRFLQEREIRDRLFGMTEAQILSHFGDSLFNGGNTLLLDAILNAPPGFEMLPEDILNNLRVVRAKKMSPKIAREIETMQALNTMTLQIFALVKEELDNLRKKQLPASLTKKVQPE